MVQSDRIKLDTYCRRMHLNNRFGRLSIAISAAMVLSAAVSARAVSQVDRIRQIIQSAQILPRDYSNHMNVSFKKEVVSLSVYRQPDAQKLDCKIDAILLTSKILCAQPSAQKVRVAFYDLSQKNSYWLTEVSPDSVRAYARGLMSRDNIIKSVSLNLHEPKSVADTYGRLSYKQMIDQLEVVDGPLKAERAIALLRINSMQEKGVNVDQIKKQYLRSEDLARRGDSKNLTSALAGLCKQLDEQSAPGSRLTELDALLNSVPSGTASSGNDGNAETISPLKQDNFEGQQ
jgi:hypothetical protein